MRHQPDNVFLFYRFRSCCRPHSDRHPQSQLLSHRHYPSTPSALPQPPASIAAASTSATKSSRTPPPTGRRPTFHHFLPSPSPPTPPHPAMWSRLMPPLIAIAHSLHTSA
ncbi:hypothetical protein SprV_0602185300 [Sparganum proliferum]